MLHRLPAGKYLSLVIVTFVLYISFLSLGTVSVYESLQRTQQCVNDSGSLRSSQPPTTVFHECPKPKFPTPAQTPYESYLIGRADKVRNLYADILANDRKKLAAGNYTSARQRITFIVTTWRSGSTFLGELFNSLPASWYHYEPMIHYGYSKHDELPKDEVVALLRYLLSCSYDSELVVNKYISTCVNKRPPDMLEVNTKHFDVCKLKGTNSHACFDPRVLKHNCGNSQFQVLKTVRLPLRYVPDLVPDPVSYDFHSIFLVRDPRAVFSSRVATRWTSAWKNVKALCRDYNDNFVAARSIGAQVNFSIIRFEDLAANSGAQTEKLFRILELPLLEDSKEYVKTHTTKTDDNSHSTFRKAETRINAWLSSGLPWSTIDDIQKECKEAMEGLGYKLLTKEEFDNKSADTVVPFNQDLFLNLKI